MPFASPDPILLLTGFAVCTIKADEAVTMIALKFMVFLLF
jgi:hypothetical protein